MITIYGAVKTLNFYDRLKNEFNFDIKNFALSERCVTGENRIKMRTTLLFSPEDLNELFT